MIKTPDMGGTSDGWDIPHLIEIFKILNPRTVLDVGTGMYGKNGYILRQYVEHKFRHLYGVKWMEIIGVEAYEKNAKYVRTLDFYDTVYDVPAFFYFSVSYKPDKWNKVDIVICTHVLEHHVKEDGWRLLQDMYVYANKAVILACPYGEYKFEGNPNPYQDHKSAWIPDEIAEKYPITTPILGYNNRGHLEFLIVIPK